MYRRDFLVTAAVTPTLPAIAGCSSLGDEETGYTYTLTFSDAADEPEGQQLDFDTSGLAASQADIVDEAARTGTYSEANVNWDSLPGREGITMAFRMVIQLIARHVGHDPQVDHETSFETPSRYDGWRYRTIVDVA
ncbi:hypothetical protein [Natrinema versiforme]|uniref:Uncharacterized protein n=1 Tax=Natrinema versiforme JCM 10478 TaxID=1227496 RepID=L9Y7V4_9EURY|nr:hypothetical protein [Natrinema versiforme]ELY70155.1 hypothetical protein C489_03201 [Natrinema versiforme JCM 10478]